MENFTYMVSMARPDFGGPILMTAKDVYTYLGISKSFFYTDVKPDPTFPKPVDFFGSDRWRKWEIDAWVNALPYRLSEMEQGGLALDLPVNSRKIELNS